MMVKPHDIYSLQLLDDNDSIFVFMIKDIAECVDYNKDVDYGCDYRNTQSKSSFTITILISTCDTMLETKVDITIPHAIHCYKRERMIRRATVALSFSYFQEGCTTVVSIILQQQQLAHYINMAICCE